MKWRCTLFAIFFYYLAIGQDPSFSQYYANRIYLNPAFAGLEKGLTVAGVSRIQWANVDGGFRTYGISLEMQEPGINSGLALHLFQDNQGLAQLNTTSVGLTYAYTIKMDNHNIHVGLQGRWVQKKVDWSKIVFSDQLDPVYGNVYATTAIPILDRITYTDFDAGVVWRFKTDLRFGKKRLRDTRYSIGIAAHHLPNLISDNAGVESFQQLETRVSPRVTFHAGAVVPLAWFANGAKSIAVSPTLKLDIQGDKLSDWQSNLQVFSIGGYIVYDGIYVGALYQNKKLITDQRNTNAFILAFGAYLKRPKSKAKNVFLGFSFDANTTGVGTRAGGVYELAFRWNFTGAQGIFNSDRRSSKKSLDCYKFF